MRAVPRLLAHLVLVAGAREEYSEGEGEELEPRNKERKRTKDTVSSCAIFKWRGVNEPGKDKFGFNVSGTGRLCLEV